MSQEKTLDNTQISNKDIKELEKGEDNKLDNTSTKSTSKPKRSHSKSNKSKSKDTSFNDASDNSLGHQATIPIDPANPHASSLANIKNALTDPKIREESVYNIVDNLAQHSPRKLTKNEKDELAQLVQNQLINNVFKIKKI